jgi:endogenous inhibitor of DNA gyrase (YacG/DUF329 family)
MTAVVRCPACAAAVAWTAASTWRPFCSERCQLIDLGDWAAERHAIPGTPVDSTDESAPSASSSEPR